MINQEKYKSLSSIFYIGIFASVVMMIGSEAYKTARSYNPPVEYHSVIADKVHIKAGSVLHIIYKFSRTRLCRTTIDRFIIRKSDTSIVFRESVPGGPGGTGEIVVSNDFTVPKYTPPGEYKLVTMAYFECYAGTHTVQAPEVNFTIIP